MTGCGLKSLKVQLFFSIFFGGFPKNKHSTYIWTLSNNSHKASCFSVEQFQLTFILLCVFSYLPETFLYLGIIASDCSLYDCSDLNTQYFRNSLNLPQNTQGSPQSKQVDNQRRRLLAALSRVVSWEFSS